VTQTENPAYPSDQSISDLLSRARPRIKLVLHRYRIPPQDAEDVLQEALMDAIKQWGTIRHREAWLAGALRFKCSQYWKRQNADRLHGMDELMLEELSPPQPPLQEQDEVRLDLESLTRGLGKRHRAALWLRYGVGLSTEEVGQRLGYCPSSIRKLTGRCMLRLQRWARSGGPSPPG
jgi:RNA polymerase sigma factor (sigma-70 family)